MMKTNYLFLLVLIFPLNLLGQISVEDSLENTWKKHEADTVKADQMLDLIFRFAPVEPEILLRYTDSVLSLLNQINDSARIATSYNRRGLVFYYLGDYNSSLDNYFKSIEVREKSKLLDQIWRDYNNIGLVLRNLEQNEEALRYFNMGLDYALQSADEPMMAILLNNIGMTQRGLGNYMKAEEVLRKSLEINQRLDLVQSQAHNFNNLANVYFFTQRYEEAESHFLKALELNKSLYNRYEEAQIYNNLINLYNELGRLDDAEKLIKSNELIINELGSSLLTVTFLGFQSDFYQKKGDLPNAIKLLEQQSAIRDSVFYASRATQFKQLQSIANIERKLQQVEFLEEINTIQSEKLRAQKAMQALALSVIILVVGLLFLSLRNLRMIKRFNRSLKDRNEHIQMLNDELKSYNEELIAKQENLNQALVELKQAQNQIIQSEKMASLGVMAAGIAHEVNNPLNFIMGGYNGLMEHLQEYSLQNNEDLMLLLESIKAGVSRAGNIVKALGQFSRGNDSLDELCDIHQIIENCIVMLRNQFKDKIEIQRDFYTTPLIVTGNVGKLHQVFVNLLHNAIQASSKGGKIIIKTLTKENQLVISIADNGKGIEEKDLPFVLDPFFTTKEPGKGTGLGLSISYNIMKDHSGDLQIASKVGKGTTVSVILPFNRTS